jgi:hypothetical protein
MTGWLMPIALAVAMVAAAAAPARAVPIDRGLLPEPPAPPAAAPGTPMPELLAALVEHSRLPLPLHDGRLGGAGGERWRSLAAASSQVVFGEQHGNAGIAAVARAMWADLAGAGWRHAFEVDPFVMDAFVQARRHAGLGGWARFLAARQGSTAVPFLGWAEEAALAAEVPEPWGLDQVFTASAPWLLRDLLAQPHHGLSPEARPAVQALADEAAQATGWLGRVDPARLHRAAAAARPGSPARALLQALHESALIYAPFSGGDGEPTTANARREQAMKLRFAAGVQRAGKASGRPPRVFVKVGAYHAMRGATPTGVQGLGGFITELAAARGEAVLTVMALCGPGSMAAVHGGAPQPCDDTLREGGDWQFLRPWVDERQPVLFDLRTWRLRPRRLQGLPAEVQRAVGSFDLLVFVPAAPAASALVPTGP